MRKMIYAVLLLAAFSVSSAQVVDRYPLIQSPNENSVIIAWNSANAGIGRVNWGTSPGNLTNTITESSANQVHGITISGLQPNTRYYYQASCGSFQSSVEYFYTAKPDSVRQMDFVVYGDCGFNSSQQDQISALMAAQPQDFGLVVGDVDQISGDNYDVNYFPHYTSMTKHTCHFTAIGNHDILTNNTNYTDAFILPHNNPANSELYYSFTWGNAKFIALDGNIDYTAGSAQYIWLQNELKCNDREWLFVFFHQPPWSNAWDVSYYIPFTPFFLYQGNTDMRTSIVPLFEQYHVDFVLNGHTHDYQRGALNGVNYFIAGGGGTSTPDTYTNNNSPNINFEQDVNNYMKFTVDHDTVHYYTYDLNGNKIDSGTFTKTFTPFQLTVNTLNVACNGQQTGGASIVVSGPKSPYSFTWSTGAITDSINMIGAGVYNVTITDVNGCIKTDSARVQQTNPVAVQGQVTNATCPGAGNGAITASVTGGTAPYQFAWSTVDSLNALNSGNYQVTATDINLCSVVQSFTVQNEGGNVTPHLVVQSHDTLICKGDSLRLDATPGFVSYHWNFGASQAAITYVHQGGSYFLQATDSFGCLVNSDTVHLTADSVPQTPLSFTTHNLAVMLSSGQPGRGTYQWNFGNGYLVTDTNSGIVYIYPSAGTYVVTLITQYYCGADTAGTTITVPERTTGITGESEDFGVTVGPNPFHVSTVANIRSSGEIYRAALYSFDGKMVSDLGEHSDNILTIARNGLAAGEYMLKVSYGETSTLLKLVIE